jgi:cell division protein FtsQ
MIRKILIGSSWLVLVSGAIFLLVFSSFKQNETLCSGFNVTIDYQGADHMISPWIIKNQIKNRSGDPVNHSLSDINIENIELGIRAIPYVLKADVFLTIEGTLEARIIQRKPIMRVINRLGQEFYADEQGNLMPSNPRFPARVIIVNGNITFPYSAQANLTRPDSGKHDTLQSRLNIYRAFHVVRQAIADTFLQAQLSQIYFNSGNEIEITPAFGNHLILFGDTTNTQGKFDKLQAFYIQAMPKVGWETYKTINLKYENQIICIK